MGATVSVEELDPATYVILKKVRVRAVAVY
jgi:hypothetical protein